MILFFGSLSLGMLICRTVLLLLLRGAVTEFDSARATPGMACCHVL